MSTHNRRALRAVCVTAGAGLVALLSAGPAFAHVTAQPGTAAQGSESVVTFRVPDEDDSAGTVAVTVTLPADHPFSTVRTTPIPGWTATTTQVTLNPPIKTDDGDTVTQTAGSVTWKANPGTRIAPGQYLDFPLLLGAMPTDTDTVRFTATQTYDNGEVVNWADPPKPDGSEPEHPAPTLRLTPADPADSGNAATGMTASAPPSPTASSDSTARWLGGLGLLLGALGLGVGVGALLAVRRARKVQ